MNVRFGLKRQKPCGVLPAPGWLLLLFLAVALPLSAQEHFLKPGQPDGIALLPPPPAAGSAEEQADLAAVRAAFNNRTPEAEAKALKDQSLSFSLFAPSIGPAFQLATLPKTEALLRAVKLEIGQLINNPKNHWKRQRPYELDEHLVLGKPEDSYGYPSGHSTRGTVYAGVLAELFPEKKEGILAMGRQIGWDRVVIGKHFLTDINAGRVLGKAIVRELLASPTFQHALAEARAEIQSQDAHVTVPAAVPAGAAGGS